MNDWREFLFWWFCSIVATTTIVGGKLGLFLFRLSVDPPEDPILAAKWRMRRRWLAYSELSALPAFSTISVTFVIWYRIDPIVAVMASMFLGGIGFALLLDGAEWLFRKRLGLPEKARLPANGPTSASSGELSLGSQPQESP